MSSASSNTACNATMSVILETSWDITCILIWTVGVLGNLLNILIFGHKNMRTPINSILWWLAVSDLIQLLVIALYGWCCGWCPYVELFFPGPFETPMFVSVLFLFSIYLLQVFRTITIGLNVILAFWRYKYFVTVNTFWRKFQEDNRSVRKTVFLQYVFSFLTGAMVFYALKIHKGTKESYVVYYRPSVVMQNDTVEIQDDLFLELCIIAYGFILRVAPLIFLIVISVKQIFWLSRDRKARQQSSLSGVIAERQRHMDRIKTLIMWILFMFVIIEIPFIVSGVLRVLNHFYLLGTILIRKKILAYVQKITLLISSSCNIFYYLIISTQYKETMKLLLCSNRQNRHQVYISESVTTLPSVESVGHGFDTP